MNNSMWYDYHKVLSYNALLNFIIGERGVGKSYGAKKHVINKYIKNKDEFVYLRRYKTELKNSVPRFFDDINNNEEFKDHKLSVKNGNFYCDGKIMGYSIALSTANILKSTSFAKVKTIIFDEFIIDKGCYHYLQNEVTQLLDIIETIARLRDINVLFLGNAISINNPYFNYFDLSLPYNSDIKTFKDGLIVVNYIRNDVYREVKKNTRFGKLIENTEYGNYAIDNAFLRDKNSFVAKKGNCKFFLSLVINGTTYGCWKDWESGYIYISNDYDKNSPFIFALTSDDHNEHTLFTKAKNNGWFKVIIDHYKNARLYFESQKIKNNVMEILIHYVN